MSNIETSHFPSDLESHLASMMDVVCTCGNVRMGAHKSILALRSSVLAGILYDSTEPMAELPFVDDDPEAVRLLLTCLYDHEMPIPMYTAENHTKALQLAAVAHKYGIRYPSVVEAVSDEFQKVFEDIQYKMINQTQLRKIQLFSRVIFILTECEPVKHIVPRVYSQALDLIFLGNIKWLPIFTDALIAKASKETLMSIISRMVVGGPQCGYLMPLLKYTYDAGLRVDEFVLIPMTKGGSSQFAGFGEEGNERYEVVIPIISAILTHNHSTSTVTVSISEGFHVYLKAQVTITWLSADGYSTKSYDIEHVLNTLASEQLRNDAFFLTLPAGCTVSKFDFKVTVARLECDAC